VNLDDASTEYITVTNFPGRDGDAFDLTSAVFVEKLNRIYFVGGWSISIEGFYRDYNNIWFIDLIRFIYQEISNGVVTS
jgi:hypothetical protein